MHTPRRAEATTPCSGAASPAADAVHHRERTGPLFAAAGARLCSAAVRAAGPVTELTVPGGGRHGGEAGSQRLPERQRPAPRPPSQHRHRYWHNQQKPAGPEPITSGPAARRVNCAPPLGPDRCGAVADASPLPETRWSPESAGTTALPEMKIIIEMIANSAIFRKRYLLYI